MVIKPARGGMISHDSTRTGTMNRKHAALVLAGVLLVFCVLYFFFARGSEPLQEANDIPAQNPAPPQWATEEGEASPDRAEGAQGEEKTEAVHHPKDIEGIKKQIYDLNIESVEDLPRLDSVVQTGNAPTRDFWLGGWASVDDFKEETNGFKLEPQGDGTFMFYPDENTTRTYTFFESPKTYTYDPVKKEFYWELDYYGKTISHRARFINDNVLAMMLISGTKVTLDIYQKQPPAGE
jgi:hypothetical protein